MGQPKTIAVFSGKGGVGKSTIAAALAVAAGNSTILDSDPQATLATWGDRRNQEPSVLTVPMSRAGLTAAKLQTRYAFVDTPGALVGGVLDVLRTADLVVVPTPIDQFDLDALGGTLDALSMAGSASVLIINRLHPSASAETALEIVQDIGCLVCPVVVRERASHKRAAIDGLTALESEPNSPAATEIQQAWNWLQQQLEGGLS